MAFRMPQLYNNKYNITTIHRSTAPIMETEAKTVGDQMTDMYKLIEKLT